MADTAASQSAAQGIQQTQTGVQSATSTTSTVPATGTSNAAETVWVNPDGTLKEGWQENLIPEEFRSRPVYKTVGNDIKGLLKHIGHQDIAISKQGKGIFVPGADASETEKEFFYKAIGRPDKPEMYKVNIADDLKESYNDTEAIEGAKQALHKVGATQAIFDTIMQIDQERTRAALEDLKANPLPYYEELLPLVEPIYKERCEKELKTRWGDMYDARLHLANRAIVENTKDGEERELLLSRVGNDPIVADFIATIMSKSFVPGTGPNTATGTSTANAGSLDQRIEEITAKLTEQLRRTDRPRYNALLEERSKLYEARYKDSDKS